MVVGNISSFTYSCARIVLPHIREHNVTVRLDEAAQRIIVTSSSSAAARRTTQESRSASNNSTNSSYFALPAVEGDPSSLSSSSSSPRSVVIVPFGALRAVAVLPSSSSSSAAVVLVTHADYAASPLDGRPSNEGLPDIVLEEEDEGKEESVSETAAAAEEDEGLLRGRRRRGGGGGGGLIAALVALAARIASARPTCIVVYRYDLLLHQQQRQGGSALPPLFSSSSSYSSVPTSPQQCPLLLPTAEDLHDPTSVVGSAIRWTAPVSYALHPSSPLGEGGGGGDGVLPQRAMEAFTQQYVREGRHAPADAAAALLPFPCAGASAPASNTAGGPNGSSSSSCCWDLLKLRRNESVMQRLTSFGDAILHLSLDDVAVGGDDWGLLRALPQHHDNNQGGSSIFDDSITFNNTAAFRRQQHKYADDTAADDCDDGDDLNNTACSRPMSFSSSTARRLSPRRGGGSSPRRGAAHHSTAANTTHTTDAIMSGGGVNDERFVVLLTDASLYVTRASGALVTRVALSSVVRVTFAEDAERSLLVTNDSSAAKLLRATSVTVWHTGDGGGGGGGGEGGPLLSRLQLSCGPHRRLFFPATGHRTGASRSASPVTSSGAAAKGILHHHNDANNAVNCAVQQHASTVTCRLTALVGKAIIDLVVRAQQQREGDTVLNSGRASVDDDGIGAHGRGGAAFAATRYLEWSSRGRARRDNDGGDAIDPSPDQYAGGGDESSLLHSSCGPNVALDAAVRTLEAQIRHRDAVLRRLRQGQGEAQRAALVRWQQSKRPHVAGYMYDDGRDDDAEAHMSAFLQYVDATESYVGLLESRLVLSASGEAPNNNAAAQHTQGSRTHSTNANANATIKTLLAENAALRSRVDTLEVEKAATAEATSAVLEELGAQIAAARQHAVMLNSRGNADVYDRDAEAAGALLGTGAGGAREHPSQTSLLLLSDLRQLMHDAEERARALAANTNNNTSKARDTLQRRLQDALSELKRRDRVLDEVLAMQQQTATASAAKRSGNAANADAIFSLLGEQMETLQGRFEAIQADIANAERRVEVLRAAERRVEEAIRRRVDEAPPDAERVVEGLTARIKALETLAHTAPIMRALAVLTARVASVRDGSGTHRAAAADGHNLSADHDHHNQHGHHEQQQQSFRSASFMSNKSSASAPSHHHHHVSMMATGGGGLLDRSLSYNSSAHHERQQQQQPSEVGAASNVTNSNPHRHHADPSAAAHSYSYFQNIRQQYSRTVSSATSYVAEPPYSYSSAASAIPIVGVGMSRTTDGNSNMGGVGMSPQRLVGGRSGLGQPSGSQRRTTSAAAAAGVGAGDSMSSARMPLGGGGRAMITSPAAVAAAASNASAMEQQQQRSHTPRGSFVSNGSINAAARRSTSTGLGGRGTFGFGSSSSRR